MADNEAKLDWMYKVASSLVDREEYLLGRTVDKTLEQLNNEEKVKKLGIVPPKNHVEHECIPPSIRDFNKIVEAEQVDLSAKLQEDPLVAIRKREEEARRQFLQNPVQLKKLQEALKAQQKGKKNKMRKKRKHDSSDSELDEKLMDKLKYLKHNSLALQKMTKHRKKSKVSALDTILMHKFNELKDKLTEEDMKDIMEGRLSDSSSDNEKQIKKRRKQKDSSSTDKELKPKHNEGNRGRNNSSDTEVDTTSKRSRKVNVYSHKIEESKTKQRTHSKDEHSSRKNNSSDGSKHRNVSHNQSNSSDCSRSNQMVKSLHSKKFVERKMQEDCSDSESDNKRHTARNEYRHGRVYKNKEEKYSSSDQSSEEENSDGKNRSLSHRKNHITKKKKEYIVRYNNSGTDTDDTYRSGRKIKGREKGKKNIRNKYVDESSNSSSSEEEHHKRNFDKQRRKHSKENRRYANKDCDESKNKKNDSNDLDNLILEKLRLLRDSSSKHKNKETDIVNSNYDSDEDKPVYKEKQFGLLKADGTKIQLKKDKSEKSTIMPAHVIKNDKVRKPDRKQTKRLTECEKEQLRQQMMKDAKLRDNERSENLRKYREENKEETMEDFDKNFAHKELLKSTKNTSVEDRIKSKINNIQRSSAQMNSNFSKRS